MLDNKGCGLIREILQDVGGIIDIGQVGLAGMLACLKHLLFIQGRNDAVLGRAPFQAVEVKAPLDKLVQGSRLIRVFTVP